MAGPQEGHGGRLVSQDRWKSGFRYWLCVAVAVLSATVLPSRAGHAKTLAEVVGAVRTSVVGLFGSLEFKANSLEALPQWRRVLTNFPTERVAFSRCIADPTSCTTATLANWRRIVHLTTRLGSRQKLGAVNSYFNHWPYRRDRKLYGHNEHWATPWEFMSRAGDCEDYAIAKYFALREVGLGPDDLRIVILRDEIRDVSHAVLAVYLVDDIVILDNLSDQIFSHSRYKHYVPLYSMNEVARWTHVDATRRKERHAYRGLEAQKQWQRKAMPLVARAIHLHPIAEAAYE
jgi:predicted transglutaminase-like cysteine proteinase